MNWLGKFIIAGVLGILLIPSAVPAEEFDHSSWDSLLKKHVSGGMVDYQNLKAQDMPTLKRYLDQLAAVDAAEFKNWSSEAQIAFWINAYNAITLYGIIINYPIQYGGMLARLRFPQSSIRQINDFWDTVFSPVNGDKAMTLNKIEHDILRKKYDEPRIHFALVCASMGCPILLSEAYLADTLDNQLEKATRGFITSMEKNYLDRENNTLYLSSVFDWYAEDFRNTSEEPWLKKYSQKERGYMQFLVRYVDDVTRQHLIEQTPKIKHMDYDWSLNEQK